MSDFKHALCRGTEPEPVLADSLCFFRGLLAYSNSSPYLYFEDFFDTADVVNKSFSMQVAATKLSEVVVRAGASQHGRKFR
jgi:hypothetical protein